MKRFLALILATIMVLSLCACGKDQKAEKYCFNCGEGFTKEQAQYGVENSDFDWSTRIHKYIDI